MATHRVYAQGTKVKVSSSQEEIIKALGKHGVKRHAVAQNEEKFSLQFQHKEYLYRIEVPIPRIANINQREQRIRELWRLLVLVIKSKLESVASGLFVFDQEFMPFIVDPTTNTTAYVTTKALIAQAYQSRPLALENKNGC